jgi:hypothetical protein
MTLHTELPIYKTGAALLSLAMDVQVQMPRAFKRSIGQRIHDHCIEMLDAMALANASQRAERQRYIEELLKLQRTVTVLLRVSFDRRMVSPKLWGTATQLLDSIGRQAGGWLKSARERAPAA